MSQVIDDLNASVANLQSTANATVAKIDELRNTNNDQAVIDATNAINAVVEQLSVAIQ